MLTIYLCLCCLGEASFAEAFTSVNQSILYCDALLDVSSQANVRFLFETFASPTAMYYERHHRLLLDLHFHHRR